MNRSYHNIEYRPFHGKRYRVGYAPLSGVWHINGTSGRYYCVCQTGRDVLGVFHASSLSEVSSMLACR